MAFFTYLFLETLLNSSKSHLYSALVQFTSGCTLLYLYPRANQSLYGVLYYFVIKPIFKND